ncbi:hypothetical protein BC943DRAFT_4715 [Umbelopsis sp. AD052]|nr:hypothetical protein BC943DRAFT_4715 [Umbelopsis sp. AD052]
MLKPRPKQALADIYHWRMHENLYHEIFVIYNPSHNNLLVFPKIFYAPLYSIFKLDYLRADGPNILRNVMIQYKHRRSHSIYGVWLYFNVLYRYTNVLKKFTVYNSKL